MMVNNHWLVVTGTMEFYDFPFSWEWNVIIPTDSYLSEGLKPPTRTVCIELDMHIYTLYIIYNIDIYIYIYRPTNYMIVE